MRPSYSLHVFSISFQTDRLWKQCLFLANEIKQAISSSWIIACIYDSDIREVISGPHSRVLTLFAGAKFHTESGSGVSIA